MCVVLLVFLSAVCFVGGCSRSPEAEFVTSVPWGLLGPTVILDSHTHTVFSDGALAPQALAAIAVATETGLSVDRFSKIVIAYEPCWAIGTGKVATPEIAAEAHRFIRDRIRKQFGAEPASACRILYGGSVKPDNIRGLMAQPDIDGALVGGASLDPDSFASIVNF